MNIIVYTRNLCAYCNMVKKYLDTKGVIYTVINLDDNPEYAEEVYKKSGALTAPITIISNNDNEKVVIGYNLSSLSSALV